VEWWQIVLLSIGAILLALGLAAFVLWRTASARVRVLGERLGRLPWRLRMKLAWRLMGDERVPLPVRSIPPLLVLYLAMPLDLVPDVIPIIGQLDDLLVLIVALALLTRFVPLTVVDGHLAELEDESRDGV
jgi:uncharacterized membrane protein YkvA (DUF1232 family)